MVNNKAVIDCIRLIIEENLQSAPKLLESIPLSKMMQICRWNHLVRICFGRSLNSILPPRTSC